MIKNAVGLFVFAIVMFLLFLPSYTKMQDLQQKNLDLSKSLHDFKKQNVQLKREKKLLEYDPVYLEKVAREKMGLIREGEVVYKMVPPAMNATVPIAPKAAPKKETTPAVSPRKKPTKATSN